MTDCACDTDDERRSHSLS